ncbi:MAG: hypothetical protein HEQ32_07010 [Vampirovibrio sp.]
MSFFSIPTEPLTYYDWRQRKKVTIGSPASTATLKADSTYTIRLADINASDAVGYTLPTIQVNADTSTTDPNRLGFWWWNPKTQRLTQTSNYADYASTFTAANLSQTYRLSTAGFTTYGDPFVSRLTAYTPPANTDFLPYYTQGAYASAVRGLVMSREEWQALFDSANDVALPNLGMEVRQYGDGVKVIQNADGSLGILSDTAGGILSIRRKLTANQWFWLLDFPALDDLSINQASQRLPTVIDLVAGLSSPSKGKTSTAASPAPLTPPPIEEATQNSLLADLPSFNTPPVQESTSADASDSSNRENPVNVDPLKATSPLRIRPAVFSRQATPFATFTGDRSTNTLSALPERAFLNLSFNLEGERLVKDAVRRSNITADARRVPIPLSPERTAPPPVDDDDAPPPFKPQQGQTNLASHPRQEDPDPRPSKRKPLP